MFSLSYTSPFCCRQNSFGSPGLLNRPDRKSVATKKLYWDALDFHGCSDAIFEAHGIVFFGVSVRWYIGSMLMLFFDGSTSGNIDHQMVAQFC